MDIVRKSIISLRTAPHIPLPNSFLPPAIKPLPFSFLFPSLPPPPPLLLPLMLRRSAFQDSPLFSPTMSDSDHLLFDLDDNKSLQIRHDYPPSFDHHSSSPNFPVTPSSTNISLDPMGPSDIHPSHALFDSGPFSSLGSISLSSHDLDNQSSLFSEWLNDPSLSPIELSPSISFPPHSPSLSIASPSSNNDHSLFSTYNNYPYHTKSSDLQFPRLVHSSFAEPLNGYDQNDFVSPHDTSLQQPPQWVSHLWETPLLQSPRHASPQLTDPPSPLFQSDDYATQRQRFPIKRGSTPINQIFMSSSAPSAIHVRERTPSLARPYSRRAESVSESDDRNATVRRTKRVQLQEVPHISDKAPEPQPKSLLRPPKLAPSAWQLYFTDFIQRAQASSSKKLNVAQAAKEAGHEYSKLSAAEKEIYKRRSQAAKEVRERELMAYMRTLTPDDIKRENAFRTAQRKAGRSRKANMKDPNAPKKPLSAYFMFLQRIRSDPDLVRDVFGDETETTKQSVLAAAKWRSMTDDERKPFLAQAEQDKLEYEAARKLYENGSIAYESSIDFGTTPFMTSTLGPTHRVKSEFSESDSDGSMTDDSAYRVRS